MNFIFSFIALFLVFAAASADLQLEATCTSSCVRKEIRTFTATELSKLNAAFIKLNNNKTYVANYPNLHYAAAWASGKPLIHRSSRFLPWHRLFIRKLELDLQKITNDKTICLPYWNWTLDAIANKPAKSPVFGTNYFGGITANNPASCVTTGSYTTANKWIMPSTDDSNAQVCLMRSLAANTNYPSIKNITDLMKITLYKDFEQALELDPHATVHGLIGAFGGQMSAHHSPADPLFFLHHAFVDKIWNDWQAKHPNAVYDGVDTGLGIVPITFPVAKTDVMTPYTETVNDVWSSSNLCVSYAASPATATPVVAPL